MRNAIVDICHQLYARGHVVATSGNVSVRTEEGILITPTATRKDTITAQDIVTGDSNDASSEIRMHAAAYAARSDVHAIIHAHCPYCVACSLMEISLVDVLLPETIVYIGSAPTVPYAMPGSSEQAAAVQPYLADHNALLLARHGVLVMGDNLEHAFSRMEQLEHAARIAYLASLGNKVEPLSPAEIEKLQASRFAHRT